MTDRQWIDMNLDEQAALRQAALERAVQLRRQAINSALQMVLDAASHLAHVVLGKRGKAPANPRILEA